MRCEIQWNVLELSEWESLFGQIRRSTLLQSYDYARAICPAKGRTARWGLIKIDGRQAGLVQLLEAGIFRNALHGLILDRGPLWLPGFGGKEHGQAFFETFAREFPRRPGRRRRIIPEIEAAESPDYMNDNGFRRLPRPGYRTIWLDLGQDAESLRAGMQKNWRNALGRAERSGMEIRWDESGAGLSGLLTNYQSDRAKKGYGGPSAKLLGSLAEAFILKGGYLAGEAFLDNRPVAAILVLCHGSAATYQTGWTSADGRQNAAHNLLLWQAVLRLKEKGIQDFDLGGTSDETKGIGKFKEGMGGSAVFYAGHYC